MRVPGWDTPKATAMSTPSTKQQHIEVPTDEEVVRHARIVRAYLSGEDDSRSACRSAMCAARAMNRYATHRQRQLHQNRSDRVIGIDSSNNTTKDNTAR